MISGATARSTMTQPTYEELYGEHRVRIVSLCRLLLADAHEAEEVGQEVFCQLLRQMGIETREMAWGPWLTRVAVNACRDRRRSGWWKLWRGRSDELDEGRMAGAGPSPEDLAIGRQQRALIWQAFRLLPTRQREVFALRQVEGWSTEEVAESLGISQGSVKQHMSRAVQKLRVALRGAV